MCHAGTLSSSIWACVPNLWQIIKKQTVTPIRIWLVGWFVWVQEKIPNDLGVTTIKVALDMVSVFVSLLAVLPSTPTPSAHSHVPLYVWQSYFSISHPSGWHQRSYPFRIFFRTLAYTHLLDWVLPFFAFTMTSHGYSIRFPYGSILIVLMLISPHYVQ